MTKSVRKIGLSILTKAKISKSLALWERCRVYEAERGLSAFSSPLPRLCRELSRRESLFNSIGNCAKWTSPFCCIPVRKKLQKGEHTAAATRRFLIAIVFALLCNFLFSSFSHRFVNSASRREAIERHLHLSPVSPLYYSIASNAGFGQSPYP